MKKVRSFLTALSLLNTRIPLFVTKHNTSQTQQDVVSYLNVPRLYV